jgi:hypothetical protein
MERSTAHPKCIVMKKFTTSILQFSMLITVLLWSGHQARSQVQQTLIFSEKFDNISPGQMPAGWQYSNNADAAAYFQPYYCNLDTGFHTPAVGKGAPVHLILPALDFSTVENILLLRFKVYVMDASLKCAINFARDFPCPTYVRVMLVKNSFSGGANDLPDAADIYAEQTYRIATANGDNTIVFNAPPIANGEQYRIFYDFKTAFNSTCVSTGTKFVFDDFSVSTTTCYNDCAPVANDDFFDGSRQSFNNFLRANVYGGFALWSDVVAEGYEKKSLSTAPAVNEGLDYDVNNHPLSQMTFTVTGSPQVIDWFSGSSTNTGSFTFHQDGSFELVRTDLSVKTVRFSYMITDPTNLVSDTATVTVKFPFSTILPVSLPYFNAQRNRQLVHLSWQTLADGQHTGCFVQRNTDGMWKDRGYLPSGTDAGESERVSYAFTDSNSFSGVSQYRIVLIDADGKAVFSEIRMVAGSETAPAMLVFPNPAHAGNVTVMFGAAASEIDVDLLDASGRMVQRWKGLHVNYIRIQQLKPGTYFAQVRYKSSGTMQSAKIIILP